MKEKSLEKKQRSEKRFKKNGIHWGGHKKAGKIAGSAGLQVGGGGSKRWEKGGEGALK